MDVFYCRIWSCSTAVYKSVWHTPLLSVQWINSRWGTDELSETCRVSWQNKFVKLVHPVGFIIKKWVTMQVHMNVEAWRIGLLHVETTFFASQYKLCVEAAPVEKWSQNSSIVDQQSLSRSRYWPRKMYPTTAHTWTLMWTWNTIVDCCVLRTRAEA